VQAPRRDAARCLDFRATAPATAQSRPRQRALQGTRRSSEPTVRAVAFGHRLNAWVALRSCPRGARSPRHQLRWRAALRGGGEVQTLGRRLRRESRRCRCVGCQRRHVCVVWSRDFDVCNVDAPPPCEGAETDRDGPLRVGREHLAGCLPGQRPCTGALLETFGFRGCRSPTGAALNKCLAARPVVPRRVNDLLLGIRPTGWIARSATASAACQLFGVLRGAPRGLRSHPGLKFLQLSSVVPARGSAMPLRRRRAAPRVGGRTAAT
jgi:hypothetical protein